MCPKMYHKHKKYLEKFLSFFDKYPREYIAFGFFVLSAFFLISVVFSYTVLNFSFYTSLAYKQQVGEVTMSVTRWNVFSSTNSWTVFATSVNLYDVAVDPQMVGNKDKLISFLSDVVYKQFCSDQKEKTCYSNMLKFLKVLEIENFMTDEVFVKWLITEKIVEKLSKTKVTSVLISSDKDEEKKNKVKNLSIVWVYASETWIYANPEEINDIDFVALNFQDIFWGDIEEYKGLLKKRDIRYIPILNRISLSLYDEISNYLKDEKDAMKKWVLDEENSLSNFIVLSPNTSRLYPEKQLAAQILWFVDNDGQGQYGLEWFFNESLRWKKGWILSRKDVLGRVIDSTSLGQEDKTVSGINIYTTIDRNIQSKVEQVLEEWVKTYRANKGSIVVMDPFSGDIIAMANYPTFDPNSHGDVYELEKVTFSKYPNPGNDLLGKVVLVEDNEKGEEFIYDGKKIKLRLAEREELGNSALVKYKYINDFGAWVYKNDVISSLYEPGSIMKAIIVAMWIDTWEIKRYDMYNDTWEVKIDNFTIKNVSDNCLWYKSFWNALNFSCNVWMIRIAQKIGPAIFSQYLQDFWFWKPTGISIDGEVTWVVTPYEKWSKAQLFTQSFWLWISVTPLQMAAAYSVIANGWYYVKPKIIKSIEWSTWNMISYKKDIQRRVIKSETSKIVTEMLVDWVENWVARTGGVPGYTIAWKTWTSQIAYKWGYESWMWSTVASYAWFAPAEEPKFVIIVKLERSRVDIYWGATSSKMFAEVSKYLFDYYGIPSKQGRK